MGLRLGDIVPPDEAECMLEVEFDLALEDDKQLVVEPMSKDLILDEVEDLLTWAVILSFEVVEAFQLFEGVD